MLMKNFTQFSKSLALFAVMATFAFNASAATILSETFSTSLGGFTTQSLVGDQVWAWNTSEYAKMSGFVSNVNNPNDDWLISPSMDFSDVTKANLIFEHAHKYGVNVETTLTLMVSDSYTGGTIDTSKWTAIAFTHSDQTTWNFVNTGPLALDAYKGKENVHFAFRYKSTSTASATWEIKNVLVESVVVAAETIVLQEDFAGFTTGTQDVPSGTDVATTIDTYTKVAGWLGSKVYPAGGATKMGSSSSLGFLTTPTLNLSSNGGKFSITLDSRAWSGDSTAIKVYVNDVLVRRIEGLSNTGVPYTLSTYGPYELTGGTATTKIKFEGLQATKGRFFMDNLKISQGGVAAPTATLTTEKFSVENGTNLTKSLILKGKGITGNLTVALTNKVGTAFSTTVSSVTALQVNDTLGFAIPVKYAPAAIGIDTALVSITGGGLAVAVTAIVSGNSWTTVSVADLGALRAAFNLAPTDFTTVYKITGEVLVNYTNISGNSKYLQDATGGAMIYDTKGLIKNTFAIGDGMKNLKGTLAVYGKLIEIIPVEDVAVSSTGNAIIPVIMTIPDVKTNLSRYESTLIQINNIKAGKTGDFSASKANYNFGNGSDTIVIRTNYTGMDYMGTAIPTNATNVRGILIQYNGTAQLVPRFLTDFGVPSSLSAVKEIANIYGSDGILNVEAKQGQLIEVYNIMGRKVMNAVANEGTNTFSLGRNQLLLVKVGDATSKIVL